MSRENKQEWWSMLQWYVVARGKKPGWAAHTYKDKFGVWPKGLSDVPKQPNLQVQHFVDNKRKQYITKVKKGLIK